MRKFVDKNRKKRKYTKQLSGASMFSVPDLVFVGLFPSILFAAAYVITSLRQPIDLNVYYNPPSFSTNPYELLLPIRQMTGEFTSLVSHALQNSLDGAGNTGSGVAIEVPDKTSAISTALTETFVYISNTISDTVGSLVNAIRNLSQALTSYIAAFIELLVNGITAFTDALFSLFRSVVAGILSLLETMLSYTMQVARTIGSFFSMVIENVTSAAAFMTKAIKTPFVALGEYLKRMQPFFSFIGASIKIAIHDLQLGFADLVNVSQDLTNTPA